MVLKKLPEKLRRAQALLEIDLLRSSREFGANDLTKLRPQVKREPPQALVLQEQYLETSDHYRCYQELQQPERQGKLPHLLRRLCLKANRVETLCMTKGSPPQIVSQ
jgi:hypothetical protein